MKPNAPPLHALLALTVAAVVAAMAPGAARADGEEPRCDDGKRAPKAAICGAFEAAPRLGADDAVAKKVLNVWRRVSPPVAALTGRESALAVLAPDALVDGKPFPPTAYICPGAPPTVYVPYTLVEKVYGEGAAYPEDFMGFVLGHELGHRVNDFTADGCQLGAFERPGRGVKEEQLADFRGAFFAAIGGYSTRALAKKNTVSSFLEAEFKVRGRVRDERQEALLSALEDFDAYEELYAAAVALTFAGEQGTALRLLGWADELVEGRGVPLPELKVVRALALMLDAADNAPWLEATDGMGVDLSKLRCRAIFASHTALAEEPAGGRLRGPGEDRERARRQLQLARRLLDRAAELGADALVTDSGRACVAFYLGETGDAQRLAARARRRLGTRAPAAVKRALDANDALIAFGAFLATTPAPPRTDADAAKAWAKKVVATKKAFAAHAELAREVDVLATYPAPPPRTAATSAMVACPKGARGGTATIPPPPAFSGPVGTCPAGTTLVATVPSPEAVARSGTGLGVTTCRAADGALATRVQLAGALDPPYGDVDTALRAEERVPAAVAKVDAWACGCDALQLQGISDTGDEVYMTACPAYGVPLGVLFVKEGGAVRRVVTVGD
ncbi:MAG: hypothetical protein H6745_03485 [Deltaproteobacteria bacterium]|nr:hypothetical protein [Deltaproteobacteria bacterium]